MFDGLLKFLPLNRATLEAALQGVNGFTGRGKIDYAITRNGARQLNIELRGVAGRSADIYIANNHIAAIDLDNGRADKILNSRKGDAVPNLVDGVLIQVNQNGDIILEGMLNTE